MSWHLFGVWGKRAWCEPQPSPPPSILRGFLATSQRPSLSLGGPGEGSVDLAHPRIKKGRDAVGKACGKGEAGLTGQSV